LGALTLAAVIAHAVPGLGVGTAIVPINPRHPLLVASAAQTAQAAARGNFSLGIGLGGNELGTASGAMAGRRRGQGHHRVGQHRAEGRMHLPRKPMLLRPSNSWTESSAAVDCGTIAGSGSM
jgi:hypothetical protein